MPATTNLEIHLQFKKQEGPHQLVSLFVNHQHTGYLCMSPAEAIWLNHILAAGCKALSPEGLRGIQYVASGQVAEVTAEEIDKAVSP